MSDGCVDAQDQAFGESVPPALERAERKRWLVCAGVSLLVHAGIVGALVRTVKPFEQHVSEIGSIVVEIAMQPAAAASADTSLPPGPSQAQTEPAVATPKATTGRLAATAAPLENEPDVPPLSNPELAMVPPPQPPAENPPETHSKQTAVQTASAPHVVAAPTAELAAASTRGSQPALLSPALPKWMGAIAVMLERNKRYPADARSRGAQGTAQVAFVLDRGGRVVSRTLVQSSGVAVLDQEALALLGRAQPFPPPPGDVPGDQISLTVPILFTLR